MRFDETHWSGLFRAANGGDEKAYKTVLAMLATSLRISAGQMLRRMGRPESDAEDIVQETLIAIHTKRHSWDASQPLEPWVRTILRYKLIDSLRRRTGMATATLEDIADSVAADDEPDWIMQDVKKISALLPEKQRAVVKAIYLDGRDTRQVAGELAMSEGAVRVTLHRALGRLKEMVNR